MTKVIGIKFPQTLKIYDFLPGRNKVELRDFVLVETTQGLEIGQVVYLDREVSEKDLEGPLKEIERIATPEDISKSRHIEDTAQELMPLFVEKIERYNLPMNPVGVSLSFDETKATFYFTSEGRVDFRELSKDISRSIKKQAVLRQIGPRDEAKLIGGYGRCGRPICCGSFLLGTEGVTMETVEAQYGMPKNANKVSGVCGRLMCCLNYELPEARAKKSTPRNNTKEVPKASESTKIHKGK
jgi:cell fate regulator YaaT (PSP1 superfamily)